ncbi:GNAT family N-acetyltransferase [Parasediminibacterium sp. JCM 36343]|uniref:GNAT family N-acetyltransferase n=1 Tax=Parasediminibacterium sp. JCM 36343 TaxID=3374279 RepID=UPI00397D2026
MEHIIRKCEEKDLPVLVELCKKHSDFEQSPYNPKGKLQQLSKAIFSDSQKLFCYLIECDGLIAGYFSYTFDFSTWDANSFLYLDCLYLEPDFRGLRIGVSVFDKLKIIAKQNDCINIQWQTPIFNERAIKFYNRIGGTGKEKVRFFIDIH